MDLRINPQEVKQDLDRLLIPTIHLELDQLVIPTIHLELDQLVIPTIHLEHLVVLANQVGHMVIPIKHPNLPNHHLEGAERLKVDHVDQETKVDQEDQMDPVKLVEANAGQ